MTAFAFVCLCVLAVLALLLAEWRGHGPARALSKTLASLGFVGLAWALGAMASPYGQWVMAALLLSLLGDVLLLSRRSAAFLGGLAAFLLGHAAYAAAFAGAGVSLPVLAGAALLALPAALLVLRWLAPALKGAFRVAVPVYIAVILLMVCLAFAHALPSARWAVAAGALLFAVSDLAVARERFIRQGFINRLWGLPVYYGAQLLLAGSVQA